jgi:DNA polymerase I-like protein with 3'-5' exonuclease and polymerase domains
MSYDQIYDTKGLPGDQDKYSRSKNGVFALLYGGEAYTLVSRVGVEEATANNAYQAWVSKYVVWGQERRKIFDAFCSLKQPGGLGTKVEWHEPADYIESMLGFRRYFTLENKVCRELFALAEDPPKEWYKIKLKVTRRDREQTVTGAVRSALFGATFAIQAGNMRAAANHVIQSSGAGFTKKLQCKLWTLQPPGVNRWVVIPMNIHDEIMNPVLPEVVPKIQPIIDEYLAWMKTLVPLADIEWSNELTSWADK